MPRYTIHGDAYDGFHLSPLDERPSRFERRFIELTEDEFAEWQRTDAAYEDWQDRINRASEDEANVIPPMAGAAEYLESMYGSATAPDGSLAPGAHLVLTSMNREPGAGSVVRDSLGRLWYARTAQGGIQYWLYENHLDSDPESWTKVAGNYGPVEVVKLCGWRGN